MKPAAIRALVLEYNLRVMMARRVIFLFLLSFLGCRPGPGAQLPTVRTEPAVNLALPTRTALPPAPTSSPPTATSGFDPTQTPPLAAAAVLVAASPPTQLPVAWPPCSPLAENALSELPEIISAVYAPPPPGREERHHGVDFSYYRRGGRESIAGAPVQAIFPGVVALSLADSFPYGNVVIVATPSEWLPHELEQRLEVPLGASLYSLYAHLEQAPLVALGDPVSACQQLGAVGRSGNAGVAHLHLELRFGPPGAAFTEMGFYLAEISPEARAAYTRWRTGGEFLHFDPMLLLEISP